MPSNELIELEEYILVDNEDIYKVVGDYTHIDSPLDWELQNINNKTDEMCVSDSTVKQMMGERWKRINIDELGSMDYE